MRDGTFSADIAGIGTLGLAWREAGTGVPILLLHPYPTDGRIWRHQLQAADESALDARLVAIDLPGFGRSSLPDPGPGAFEIESLVAVGAAVAARLDLVRPVIAGVGIGGTVAAILAPRLNARALVLIGNKPGGDPPEHAEARETTAVDVVRRGSRALSAALADAALAPETDARAAVEGMIGEADPRAIAALGRTIAGRPDIGSFLADLRMPILIAGGSLDPMSPPATVEGLAKSIPGAELHVIPGAGHMAPIEAPAAVMALLARAASLAD